MGHGRDRSVYAARTLGSWRVGEELVVSEERGQGEMFTSKGEIE